MDLGDRTEDGTIDFTFSTRNVSAAPATLAGTPAISVYKANGTTQSTAGITLTVDFDSVTGLNHLRIITTDSFYAAANDYVVMITTGTVNSVSVVGTTLATFSIENRFMRGTDSGATAANLAIVDTNVDQIETAVITNAAGVDIAADIIAVKADTAATLLDTAEIGTAGAGLTDITLNAASIDLVWDEVLTGATHNVNNSSGKRLRQLSAIIFAEGTAQAGGNNTIQLEVGDVTTNDQFRRAKVIIEAGTGAGQEAIITSSVASTDTLTITPTWLTNPDATSDYTIIPAQTHQTVRNGGYDNARVYVDTANGTAGTQKGVNGTSTNPSDSLTDAYTIAANESITSFQIEPGSALTLPSDSSMKQFLGSGYTVALNGQEIGATTFFRASVVTGIGVDTGGGQGPNFTECGIGAVTLPPCTGLACGFFGTFTIGVAGNFTFGNSADVFNSSLTLDYGAALNASQFFLQSWGGGNVEIQNAGAGTGSYVFDMSGTGSLVVNANCSATTTVTLRGAISRNADVTGITYDEAANSIPETDRIEMDANSTQLATLIADDIPGLIAALNDISAAQVNAEVVDALSVDTYAEPGQGLPAAAASLATKLGFLYKTMRNKSTQTSTEYQLFADDATTVDQKATVSDDATTFTRGEIASGP